MSAQKDPPIPIRLPPDLLAEIEAVSTSTGLSKQDVMRLCLRIGLVDLSAAEHDLPGIVKKIADDKGVSFQRYAKAQTPKPQAPVQKNKTTSATDKPFVVKRILDSEDLTLTEEEQEAALVNEEPPEETAEDRLNAAIKRVTSKRGRKDDGKQKAG